MTRALVVRIVFGNDAMAEPADAAEEVRRIAALLEEGFTSGLVVDANGNRCGWWEIGEGS